MKEQIYMIPLNDAVNADDECPFCHIEREIEQDLLDFVLGSGSSYMDSNIRDHTDIQGFCREHFKKMFDYGNTLGNGWILKTHYKRMLNEFDKQTKAYSPSRISLKDKLKRNGTTSNPVSMWVKEKEDSCYICNYYKEHYARYLDTFFMMYQKDDEFRMKIKNGKGFCLIHFGDLCEALPYKVPEKDQADFYNMLCELTRKNLGRVSDDIAWLIEKFDYRNKEADWKNSKDAIQRSMQKLKGGYPADPPYKMSK